MVQCNVFLSFHLCAAYVATIFLNATFFSKAYMNGKLIGVGNIRLNEIYHGWSCGWSLYVCWQKIKRNCIKSM